MNPEYITRRAKIGVKCDEFYQCQAVLIIQKHLRNHLLE